MSYALATIWHERSRFLPAILAVAFSAVLIAVQTGLLVGLLAMMSTPVDLAAADIWVASSGVQSVDQGQPIPTHFRNRVVAQPEVGATEEVNLGFAMWAVPAGHGREESLSSAILIIGTRLDEESIAAVEPLRHNRNLLRKLSEPFTVLIDRSECGRLGIQKEGDRAVIATRTVRVVGFVDGLRSLGGAYVFCSKETARVLLWQSDAETNFIVARMHNPADAARVAARLRDRTKFPNMTAMTRDEFSLRSRMHWMMTTKAGLALAFTALLGLLVGAVVTSQTLYAATAAAQREYATLRAMGIPRWRLKMSVLAQSFWVGLGGLIVAAPITLALAQAATMINIQVRLSPIIVIPAGIVTMVMALGSGLLALRSLQRTDPVHNIR
jgi:putative ABC transport system permease protein